MKIKRYLPALFLLLAASTAFGQSYISFQSEYKNARDRAKLRLGPLFVVTSLRFENIGHDDNVYYRPKGEPIVGDYMGGVSAELKSYVFLGHTLMFSFLENPEYLFYLKESRLRSFSNSFSPAVRLNLLKRFTLSGDYHFREHTRRALSEFDSLVKDLTKGYSGSFFFETPRGSSLGFSGSVDRLKFEDVSDSDRTILLSKSLNRKETTGNIEFYYRLFSESLFFVKTGMTKYEFEDPFSRWRDSRSYQTSAGIRFPIAGRAQGTLSAGYKKFVPESEDRKSFSGFIADTTLRFRFGSLAVRLGLARDNQFSYFEDSFYYVEIRSEAGLSFYLTKILRLDYDFRSGRLDYPEPFQVDTSPGGPETIHRRDTLKTHSLGFTFKISKATGLGLRYNIFERTTNVPGMDLKRNFVGISLVQDF